MNYTVKGNKVKFNCPNPKCGVRLTTKLSQAGTVDTCPECLCKFTCAGLKEYTDREDKRREKASKRASENAKTVDNIIVVSVLSIGGAILIALGLGFMVLCAWLIAPLGDRSYTSERGYNDSIPAGMSQGDSNYIGNTAIENGMNEKEAKQMRDIINKYNNAK